MLGVLLVKSGVVIIIYQAKMVYKKEMTGPLHLLTKNAGWKIVYYHGSIAQV